MIANGILLDADYSENEANGSIIQLFLKTKNGIEAFTEDKFQPYFYIIAEDLKKTAVELLGKEFGEEKAKIVKIEEAKKSNAKNVLKLYFKSTSDLTIVRGALKELGIERREYDIPFTKRFLIDKALEPMANYEISFEEKGKQKIVKEIKKTGEEPGISLAIGSIDLETLAPERFSNPQKDAIVMISYADAKESIVFSWHNQLKSKEGLRVFGTEKEMLQAFISFVKEKKLDAIVTYNGDMFDLPYLKERGKILCVKIDIGFAGTEPKAKKKGRDVAVRLKAIQHIDAYQLILLLSRFTVVNLVKRDLESVAEQLFGEKKSKITANEINEIWRTGTRLKELIEYNREDSETALKIVTTYFPLLAELCRLVKQPLFDISRSSASQLVEFLLINRAFERNELVPNKPNEGAVKQRMLQTFKGGYVKEPIAGLHENIAVLDFTSLHPTIIISHNISPDTLNCEHEKCKTGKNLSPDRDWFCEQKHGFLPEILKQILDTRRALKKQMKAMDKKNKDFALLDARQHALKILLNSHYGYLGYARARWYSMESARAITAWSRHYIRETIHKAEATGFTALYSDTDSLFLEIPPNRSHKDIEEFLGRIGRELPEAMQLELDGYYKRGIFVSTRGGKAVAKKRYALIDYNDKLKIVGFEYVRRDWAKIAKETQKEVIEAVLKEGNPEKAVQIIRKKIALLKTGNVPKKDLVVLTQIQRPLDKYETIGPHIAAARKAAKRGKELEVGSVIGYVITRIGESISDKAELEEYVKEGNYDADYYIEHQLVPAIIKIIQELGYSKEDLLHGGKQKTLSSF